MLKKYPEISSPKSGEMTVPSETVIQNILNYSKSLEVKKTSKRKALLIHLN